MENKKWYVLRVVNGKEKKCKEYIENEIEKNEELSKNISNVLLPVEKVYKVRRGKKYAIDRNFYPGYIIIEANLNGKTISDIESIPNVMNFLKTGNKIIPLKNSEIDRILNKVDKEKDMTKYDIPFIIGENVQISDGPFKSFNGEITDINEQKKTLKLNVKIFGRDTSLELKFHQVDKI